MTVFTRLFTILALMAAAFQVSPAASAVLTDNRDIRLRLAAALAEVQPSLLENDEFLWGIYRDQAGDEGRKIRRPDAAGRRVEAASIRRAIEAITAAGPVLPFRMRVYLPARVKKRDDGRYDIDGFTTYSKGPFEGEISPQKSRVEISILPRQDFVLYAGQPFQLTDLVFSNSVAGYLDGKAPTVLSGVVEVKQTRRDARNSNHIHTSTTLGGTFISMMLTEQQVLQSGDKTPGAKLIDLPRRQNERRAFTLADLERALDLETVDGAYMHDWNGDHALNQVRVLFRWRALSELRLEDILAAGYGAGVAPDLWRLVPEGVRDEMAPRTIYGQRPGGIVAPMPENAIERRDYHSKLFGYAMPVLGSVIPDSVEIIERTPLEGEYDFGRKGLSIPAYRRNLLTGRSKDFPPLVNMPDFIPMSEAGAQALFDTVERQDGERRANLTSFVRYRVAYDGLDGGEIGDLSRRSILPPARWHLEPISLVYAAGHNVRHVPPLAEDIVFAVDIDAHRGPRRPVAPPNEVAYWTRVKDALEIAGDVLVASVLAAAPNRAEMLAALNADGTVNDPARAATALPPAQETIILTGIVEFDRDEKGTWFDPSVGIGHTPSAAGFSVPRLAFSDMDVFDGFAVPAELQNDMASAQGRLNFRGVFRPVEAGRSGGDPILFGRFESIDLYNRQNDLTGLPAIRIALTAPTQTATAPPTAPTVVGPPLVTLDHDFLDILQFRQTATTISDATLDRMMLDRLIRESRDPTIQPLPWGRFFEGVPSALNRVQRSQLRPRFKAWMHERSRALPDKVIVRFVSQGSLSNICGFVDDAWRQRAPSETAEAVLAALNAEMVGERNHLARRLVDRMINAHPDRVPSFVKERIAMLGGRGIYQKLGLNAFSHRTSSPCGDIKSVATYIDGFDPSETETSDAVIHLKSPIIVPDEVRNYEETHYIADIEDIGFAPAVSQSDDDDAPIMAGTLVVTVNITDALFYPSAARVTRQEPTPEGQPTRYSRLQIAALNPPIAQNPDIRGVSLDMSSGAFEDAWRRLGTGKFTANQIFNRRVEEQDLPGVNVDAPATEAVTKADIIMDDADEELLTVMRDDRLAHPIVAIGRAKIYDPRMINAEQLLGALLKKYGRNFYNETYGEGRSQGVRIYWGYSPKISPPQCLPDFSNDVMDDFGDKLPRNATGFPDLYIMMKEFRGPEIAAVSPVLPEYDACQETIAVDLTVINGKLYLVTWLFDLSAYADFDFTLDKGPALNVDAFIAKAADIDL